MTGWLSAERADHLVAAAHARGINRTEQLAALLLGAVDPDLASTHVLDLTPEPMRRRVGRDVIRMLEVGLRLKSAISARRTSARDRAMIEKESALLAVAAEAGT